ncbi:hypothetical protein B9Q13_04405 [Candidatus Marsarchaeota G2 archaeon ECH_B_SAG-G16]|uniref:Methyltransferase domain-containing protein n=1 Tax=Candidatus Marsarchaeota G2 archaeon ECH_B_SAG-G16 TaxID=1978167 RepID=A0A2R6C0T9_9ARCH|nr:MAG: hypothetical protein B9Q13_04405 [Candidatus Marsarchaeota G2 archaeon ECH_B_SAG-G16]
MVAMYHSNEEREEWYKRLLSKDRWEWQNPYKILKNAGLSSGMTFFDVACGPGFFTLEGAKIVGKRGWVYGLDTDEQALNICESRLKREGFSNFKLFNMKIEEFENVVKDVDFALIANALHDFENPILALRNVWLSLKKEGLLLVVDWVKRDTPIGPPLDVRMNLNEEKALLESARFSVNKTGEAGPYHYFILAKKV